MEDDSKASNRYLDGVVSLHYCSTLCRYYNNHLKKQFTIRPLGGVVAQLAKAQDIQSYTNKKKDIQSQKLRF